MKHVLQFALCVGVVMYLAHFFMSDPPPPKPAQLRANYIEAALPVLKKIGRAHLHDLSIGEETPEAGIDRVRSYAHSDAEKDVAEKLSDLLIIVEAHSDEYEGCDIKIRASLESNEWPNSFYPECR